MLIGIYSGAWLGLKDDLAKTSFGLGKHSDTVRGDHFLGEGVTMAALFHHWIDHTTLLLIM